MPVTIVQISLHNATIESTEDSDYCSLVSFPGTLHTVGEVMQVGESNVVHEVEKSKQAACQQEYTKCIYPVRHNAIVKARTAVLYE